MAITGTKLFASGDVLTAADTNQYLMRGVKVFASTAIRDAAYGGAGEPTLEEGETCYITGTDELQTYNGSSWVKMGPTTQVGKVLQVVSTTKTDTFTTTSTTYVDLTGMSCSITPSSTSSKIMIFGNVQIVSQGAYRIQIVRGTTAIAIGTGVSNRIPVTVNGFLGDANAIGDASFHFLDSPSTTSSTTYKLQVSNVIASTMQVNRSLTDTDNTGYSRAVSSLTVMEIAA